MSEIIISQQYTLVLVYIYCICEIYKSQGIMTSFIPKHTPTTTGRLIMVLSGILPIPGRIVLCKSLLDTTCKSNCNNMNLAAYLSTHHFYLWSPVEKSVLILIAGLGISYVQFIHLMIAPIVVYLCIVAWFVRGVEYEVNTDTFKMSSMRDIVLLTVILVVSCVYTGFIHMLLVYLMHLMRKYRYSVVNFKDIDFKTVMIVSFIILVSSLVREYEVMLHDVVLSYNSLSMVCVLSFVASFILGSSSKFAGVCLLTTSIFGLEYMCLFYTIDFCGYMLSPFHKCGAIARSGSLQPTGRFHTGVFSMCVLMILCSGIYTWYSV